MGSIPSSLLSLELADVRSREEARALLARHVTFSEPWQYDLLLIWAAQGYLRTVLPDECCVNLAFVGGKSAGKTTATQVAVRLAGGEMLASGTLAAIIRTFESAGVVGIDELDSNLKKEELLEGILRVGNRWGAVYKVCAPGPNGSQRPVDLKIGGPKVYNYRSQVEDALGTREYRVEMPRQRDARQIVENLFLGESIEPVAGWLREASAEALKRWTPEKVEAHLRSEAFIRRVGALPAELARQAQTAAVLLAVADVLGWELDTEVRLAVESQGLDDGVEDDVRAVLASVYQERADREAPDLEIPQQEILDLLNVRRGPGALRLTGKSFARVRREIGFRDGVNCIKDRKAGGRRVLRFDAIVRHAIGVGPEPVALDSPVSALAVQPIPTPPGPDLERAVRELGPTVRYPDGTVTDRRTGAVLRGPA